MTISAFVKHHFRHFNAATLVDAAEAWNKLLAGGGKMFVTMAGAMSTAELGLSLAEMIRQGQGPRHHAAPARTSRRTSSTSWRTTTTSASRTTAS